MAGTLCVKVKQRSRYCILLLNWIVSFRSSRFTALLNVFFLNHPYYYNHKILQKQYAALVWISRPLKDEDLQHVSSLKDLVSFYAVYRLLSNMVFVRKD